MRENSFTPGPWRVDADIANGGPYVAGAIRSSIGEFVASVYDNGPNPAADARLIAAAPELLAALEGCLVYMEHPEGKAPNGWRLTTALDAARQAIAKALGHEEAA